MTLPASLPSPNAVPLPKLSDEAAVEIYMYVESLFMLVESHYGLQIERHFNAISKHHLSGPDFDSALDDPPF